jgi:DNA-binding GntR family transcriptional regulator
VAVEQITTEAGGPSRDPTEDKAAGRRGRGGQALVALLQVLRRDLAEGVYHPREHLVEADLVDRYGASRAAVREALIQLTAEGLIERTPNRGARVRAMTLDEAIEIAEVRRALEALCAARAAERGTRDQRDLLVELATEMRGAAEANRVSEYLALNARFHEAIRLMAGHTTASAILEQFRRRPIDRFFPQPFRARPPHASVVDHERIAAAIAAGDPSAAEAAMFAHLTKLIDDLRHFNAS